MPTFARAREIDHRHVASKRRSDARVDRDDARARVRVTTPSPRGRGAVTRAKRRRRLENVDADCYDATPHLRAVGDARAASTGRDGRRRARGGRVRVRRRARRAVRAGGRAARGRRRRRPTVATTTTTTTGRGEATATTTARRTTRKGRARVGARAVRALSDSEDEEEEEEEDALDGGLGGTRAARAWSAYDPFAAAKVSGDGALAVIEEKERVAREAEERAKALLNARGRPKRDAALKTEAEAKAKERKGTDVIAGSAEIQTERMATEAVCAHSSMRISASAEERAPTSAAARKTSGEKKKREPTTKIAVNKAKKSQKTTNESWGVTFTHRVLLSSGFSPRQVKALSKKVESLGGDIATSLRDFTVFVTEAPLKRTKNVMASALLNCPMVKADWLEKSMKSGMFLDPQKFLVRDKAFERAHGYDPTIERLHPFRGKTWSMYGSTTSPSIGANTHAGVEGVVLDLLSLGEAKRTTANGDFVLRLEADPSSSKIPDRVTYLKNPKIPIYTPSHVLAACLDGVLPS